MKPIDFTGRQINIGDTIAYPVRRGSEMKLRSMTVEGIEIIRSVPPVYWLYGHSDKGRPVKVETPDRCVIIPRKVV